MKSRVGMHLVYHPYHSCFHTFFLSYHPCLVTQFFEVKESQISPIMHVRACARHDVS